jgi:hypothetical protein
MAERMDEAELRESAKRFLKKFEAYDAVKTNFDAYDSKK